MQCNAKTPAGWKHLSLVRIVIGTYTMYLYSPADLIRNVPSSHGSMLAYVLYVHVEGASFALRRQENTEGVSPQPQSMRHAHVDISSGAILMTTTMKSERS